jgi:hypothetical protein
MKVSSIATLTGIAGLSVGLLAGALVGRHYGIALGKKLNPAPGEEIGLPPGYAVLAPVRPNLPDGTIMAVMRGGKIVPYQQPGTIANALSIRF